MSHSIIPRQRSRRSNRRHAVVLGASMAGLLAARAVGESFEEVTVIERDQLPLRPENRRGVPQGRHVHNLLPRGRELLEDFFPGICDQLHDDGAHLLGDLSDFDLDFLGHHFYRDHHPLPVHVLQVSRPRLESRVRERVSALPNVLIREHTSVVAPTATADRGRITGVRVVDTAGGDPEALAADLVVDCTGRAAHGPVWLYQLGYERPPEEEVHVGLTYLSAQLRLPEDQPVPDLVLVGPQPGRSKGVALFAYEDDVWTLTVAVMGDDVPDPDLGSMLACIADVAPPQALAALRSAELLADPVAFRFPASRRRRYDKLPHLPEGYLPLGDAMCSFNPIYGQGMTVAALQADALRRTLRHGNDRLAARYLREAGRPVGVAWDLAVGSDLALPEVEGVRTARTRMVNRWVERVLAAAESDPRVVEQFLQVIGMTDPPSALFRPGFVRRVLTARPSTARPTPPSRPAVPAA